MSVEKIGKRYRAKVTYMGHQTHVGMFDTHAQAEQAVEDINRDIAKHNFLATRDAVGSGHPSKKWWQWWKR